MTREQMLERVALLRRLDADRADEVTAGWPLTLAALDQERPLHFLVLPNLTLGKAVDMLGRELDDAIEAVCVHAD